MNKLKQTLTHIKHKPLLCIGSIGIDALFFIFWGLCTAPILNTITKTGVNISQTSTSFTDIFQHAQIPTLIWMILLFYLIGYALYTLFHGSAWWIATKIARKKQSYKEYLRGFVIINLLWGVLVAINHFFHFVTTLRFELQQTLIPDITNAWDIILTIILWIIVALAFLSYPRLTITTAFTSWKKAIPLAVIAAVLLQIALLLPKPLYTHDPLIANILGFILFFPTLTFIRVYAVNTL